MSTATIDNQTTNICKQTYRKTSNANSLIIIQHGHGHSVELARHKLFSFFSEAAKKEKRTRMLEEARKRQSDISKIEPILDQHKLTGVSQDWRPAKQIVS